MSYFMGIWTKFTRPYALSNIEFSDPAQLITAKIMLDDIDKLRNRIKDIILSLIEAQDDDVIERTLDRLLRDEALTQDEYNKLEDDEHAHVHDVMDIIEIIKGGNILFPCNRNIWYSPV